MSRGLGIWQRAILQAIDGNDKLVLLDGENRSEKTALLRAAKTLEKAGRCVIVRLWNYEHTALCPCVGRPDLMIDGKPVKELSVARVPRGTGTTFDGSVRHRLHEINQRARGVTFDRMTVWRVIQKLEGRDDEVKAKERLSRIRRDMKRLSYPELRQVRRWLNERGDELWQTEADAGQSEQEEKAG
jgi:hypothetical protein